MFLKVLVIGYGNTLRSDDGAGKIVANEVAKRRWENVRSLCVHQLTPELAQEIACASTVIFVDASLSDSETLQVKRLIPQPTAISLGHLGEPRSLLALTQAIYGKIPPAYWILIPAVNFEFGEKLSPITEGAVMAALEEIKCLSRVC